MSPRNALLLLIVVLAACTKKPKQPAQTGTSSFTGCRIVQIRKPDLGSGPVLTYTFSYNNDGTVSTILMSDATTRQNYTTHITYHTGCVLASTDGAGVDSLALNAGNQVVRIYHNNGQGGSYNQVWDEYVYDTTGYLSEIVYHNYNTISSATFAWKDGDLQWLTGGTDYVTYRYDTVMYQVGNIAARISDFVAYGRATYTWKHLPSVAIDDLGDTSQVAYTKDAHGNLTYINLYPATDSGTYISYDCR